MSDEGRNLRIGAIFHHSRFTYHNGEVGKKYLILLNEPETKRELEYGYIFARVTSQEKNRTRVPPCNAERSEFFVEGGRDWFRSDTWIQLYELYVFGVDDVLQAYFSGSLEYQDAVLADSTLAELKNCVKRAEDVSEEHRKLIEDSYNRRFRK